MPYIDAEKRAILEHSLVSLSAHITSERDGQAGVLNYCITSLIQECLIANGKNYHNINELIGVLECAKLELYRRVASPYEDAKMESNGDVY